MFISGGYRLFNHVRISALGLPPEIVRIVQVSTNEPNISVNLPAERQPGDTLMAFVSTEFRSADGYSSVNSTPVYGNPTNWTTFGHFGFPNTSALYTLSVTAGMLNSATFFKTHNETINGLRVTMVLLRGSRTISGFVTNYGTGGVATTGVDLTSPKGLALSFSAFQGLEPHNPSAGWTDRAIREDSNGRGGGTHIVSSARGTVAALARPTTLPWTTVTVLVS